MKKIEQAAATRRKFLALSIGGAAGTLGLASCATIGLPRIGKAEAGYEDVSKTASHCGDCVHFEAPHSCTVVDGSISPRGVCHYFLAKA